MAFNRRRVDGQWLTDTVGTSWRVCIQHPLFIDFVELGQYECTVSGLERSCTQLSKHSPAYLHSKIADNEYVAVYLLSVLLHYTYGKSLLSDKRYRQLDHFLFLNLSNLSMLNPVAREIYLSLWRYREENGGAVKHIYNDLCAINAISLGKRPSRFWVRRPSR